VWWVRPGVDAPAENVGITRVIGVAWPLLDTGRMRRRLLLVLSSVMASSQLGCATPAPLVRLNPISETVVWVSGRAAVEKDERGVRVAVAFERQVGKKLGVRVEIENGTNRRFEIDPGEDFSFIACKGEAESSCAQDTLVIDPEEMIAGLDEAASREHAQATDDERSSGALVLLGAMADTASLADPHGGGAPLRAEAAGSLGNEQDAAHGRSLDGIEARREMWTNAALRRSTLLPGASVAGQVFIPAERDTRSVWLRIRVGNRTFPFHFRQEIREVSRQG
jgi:hypothetical protein